MLVSKGIIVVAGATVTTIVARRLSAAFRAYLLRFSLVRSALQAYQSLRDDVRARLKLEAADGGAYSNALETGQMSAASERSGGEQGRGVLETLLSSVPSIGRALERNDDARDLGSAENGAQRGSERADVRGQDTRDESWQSDAARSGNGAAASRSTARQQGPADSLPFAGAGIPAAHRSANASSAQPSSSAVPSGGAAGSGVLWKRGAVSRPQPQWAKQSEGEAPADAPGPAPPREDAPLISFPVRKAEPQTAKSASMQRVAPSAPGRGMAHEKRTGADARQEAYSGYSDNGHHHAIAPELSGGRDEWHELGSDEWSESDDGAAGGTHLADADAGRHGARMRHAGGHMDGAAVSDTTVRLQPGRPGADPWFPGLPSTAQAMPSGAQTGVDHAG